MESTLWGLQIFEVILAILLIVVILIQNKNVTLNLSTMGGWMGVVKKRGPEKVLHITTVVLATLFTINSLLLFILHR